MFEGVYTAIVTPFDQAGRVDYDRLARLVAFQMEGGIDGIVPVGTTGESPTLDMEEHIAVIQCVVKAAAGKAKVIAGTGGNSTHEALELTTRARELGVDGTLQVTPYYNKPNDRGMYKHFTQVADVGVPVVLYNVPGRSGRELSLDLVRDLSEHPQIVAIKEAAGSVDRVSCIKQFCDLDVLSGDDPLTLPMMSVGGCGVISVASNAIPDVVSRMVHAMLRGDLAEAREVHFEYHRLFAALLGLDTNPIPIKTALALMGHVEESFRLPMCSLTPEKKQELETVLDQYGLI